MSVASVVVLTGAGCEPAGNLVIGVSTSAPYVDAARMAVEDGASRAPPRGLDTLMLSEGSNQSGPAIGAAEELVSTRGMIGVVGHSNSAASLAAAPLYNDAEVVQISPTATAEVYSRAGPFSFRLVPPDSRQAEFLAEYLAGVRPEGARVAVFWVNDDYGRGLHRAFLESLEGGAFPVVVDLPHTETEVLESDISRAGDVLAETRPDVVVWLARGTILDRYLPVIRSAAPDAPVLGSDAVASILQRPGDEALRVGIRYVGFVDLGGTETLRDFASRYRERLGRTATGPDALTYDAVALLLDAIRAGAGNGPAARDHLRSLGRERPPYEGITGPIAFDEDGNVDRSYLMLTHPPGDGR